MSLLSRVWRWGLVGLLFVPCAVLWTVACWVEWVAWRVAPPRVG